MTTDAPLPFTKEPGVQADIRRTLRELLADAEAGKVEGLYIASVYKNGDVRSDCIAEKKYTLFGAAFHGLVARMEK